MTTERIVVVSSSIDKPVQNEGRVNLIVLGDAAMMSLMRTIVPAGLGYRVIDNSGNDPSDDRSNDPGKVLFQSSESQQLKENFFEECDNNPSLRSLVFSRATGFADVNYKGDSHRLFIRPMNGFPNWSLVVFRNKQPLRTLYVHILTVAGFIFFFYAILLLLPLTIAYLVRVRNHRTEWIWPSTQKADVYRKTHYAYFLLCALSLAITLGLLRLVGIDADRWTPIVLVSLIAFIGVLILAFRPKLTRPLDKLESIVIKLKMNNLLDRGNIYVWNIVALLVLMGVLPALTFYKVAYNEELKLFAKRSQLALVQGLGERYRRVKAQYSTERADAATNPSPFGNKSNEAQQFIDRRLRERRDIYTDFGTQLGQTAVQDTRPDPGLDGLMTSLVRTVPSFNETSVEMEGLTQGGAADDIWKWRIPVDANNLLRRELPTNNEIVLNLHLPGRTDAIISTQLQRFGSTWRLGLLWITVGFVAIVFLLFGIVQFVVRKVFLLDLAENLYLPTSPTDAITQNVFLVQTSPLATTNGAVNGDPTSAPYHYIDLSTKASQDEWVRKLEAEVKAQSASAVVVDHFEFRMDDRNHNYQKLKFIKFLIGSNKHVLIKSSHLPSSYPFTGTARDTLKHRPNQSSDSWAEVMTHFRRSYESRANEQILLEAIENLKGALQSNPALEYRKDRTLRLAELIKSECAGSVWLANIGKELIETLATEDLQSHQIVAQLTDRAELCYLQIWNTCSSDEKLTLLHLAQDRLLSYRDRDIEPLMQKGLIVCMPDIRLMNETFKAFVLQECLLDVDESAKLQSAEIKARKSSHLESLQIPIFVGVVGVVLFLVLTQKDMFGSPLTLITAATTSIPTVFKVLSLFQGDNTGQKVFHT